MPEELFPSPTKTTSVGFQGEAGLFWQGTELLAARTRPRHDPVVTSHWYTLLPEHRISQATQSYDLEQEAG